MKHLTNLCRVQETGAQHFSSQRRAAFCRLLLQAEPGEVANVCEPPYAYIVYALSATE